jgi:diguanylate cyclase (GGDEF)-like protein
MGPSAHHTKQRPWRKLAHAGFVLAAIAAVSAGVVLEADRPTGTALPVELAYLLPALYAGYRLRGFALAATVAAIGAGYAGALAVAFPHPDPATVGARWGITFAAVWLAAGLLGRTRAEARRLRIAVDESVRIDALTAALNRRGLEEAAGRELHAAARSKLPCSLVLCDVENFERLDENYGRATADAALVATVDRLRVPRRPRDRIGRVGREQFAVLLPETPRDAALAVAERMRTDVTSAGIVLRTGVAATPEDGATIGELLDAAVAALDAPVTSAAPLPEAPPEAPSWLPDDITSRAASA